MGDSAGVNAADTDEEIAALRNQRLELMRKSLKYKIIGDEGDTSCAVENEEDLHHDVECGELDSSESACKHVETPKECSICLDAYANGEKMATPLSDGCSHAFHDECITLWLLQHDHCPLCRTKLLDLPTKQ